MRRLWIKLFQKPLTKEEEEFCLKATVPMVEIFLRERFTDEMLECVLWVILIALIVKVFI